MSTATSDTVPRTYASLIRVFPLRPIRDEVDLENATQLMDRLAVLENLTRDQADYLEVLSGLIEAYEQNHNKIRWSRLDPVSLLRFLLEENGMSASDLGRLLGQRQLGSAILRGDRNLSKTHIKVLSEHFRVNAGLFIGQSD